MNRFKQSILLLVFAIPVLLIFAWGNYRFVQESQGGFDFLFYWVNTRSLLLGNGFYSDESALQLQEAYYGRPAQAGEPSMRNPYPLFSAVLIAPFACITNYNLARVAWMTLLELALIITTITSLKLAGWHPSVGMLTVLFLFTLIFYHSARSIINGNVIVLISLFFTISLLAIKNNRDNLAGIFLALTTIKPQIALIPGLFILVWVFTQRRWKVAISFVILLGGLLLISWAWVPSWPAQNVREILNYPLHDPPGNPAFILEDLLPGPGLVLGWCFSSLIVGIMLFEWRQSVGENFAWFYWTACMTLVASQWSGIVSDPGNFNLLFPGLILVFAGWEKSKLKVKPLAIFGSILLLEIGLWALFLATVAKNTQQHPILFFPFPLFVLIGLYSIRSMITQPSEASSLV